MKAFKTTILLFSIAILCTWSAGCSTLSKTQKGASIGAGAGATVGGLIGKAAGNTALGAIIGGAIGGTAGAYIGHTMDNPDKDIKQTITGATITRQKDVLIVKFSSDILFDAGEADLKPEAQGSLTNLATSMQNNPQSTITIIGHTDTLGTPDYNMDLSIKRAEAVKAFMVTNGINNTRVTVIGKGGTEPIADNTTDKGRAKNRRIDIIIIPGDEQGKKVAASSGNK